MTGSGTRVIGFAGTRLVIAWEGRSAGAILNALCLAHSTPASGSDSDPHFWLRSTQCDAAICLHRRDRRLYEGPSAGAAAEILLDCIVHDLADGCRVGPLFHAAAASCGGRGLLLPGQTGSGKTTLAAWLAGRGWDYLTDEIACIGQGSQEIQAFQRALHLRTPLSDSVERLIAAAIEGLDSVSGRRAYRSSRGVIVPIEYIRPNNIYHTPELRLIVFPQYLADADVDDDLIRLSPAQACARLMGCTVNVRNLSGHGLDEISRLARGTPAYALSYGRLDHLAEKIAALW
jgi:hypothetical protein